MVQRRVEHPLLLFGPALDPDSAQSLVPALAGLFPDGVERRVRSLLGIEVLRGVLVETYEMPMRTSTCSPAARPSKENQ